MGVKVIMNFSYIILHYFSAEDTIDCIKSITKLKGFLEGNNHIVVVDNASPNNSLDIIKATIGNQDYISYLQSHGNLGFAKGNNLGIKYAKKHFDPDFVIALNNDTITEQLEFQDIIEQKYKETSFFVMGPDIITIDGFHQNPPGINPKQSWTIRELKSYRLRRKIENILLRIGAGKVFHKKFEMRQAVYRKNKVNHDIKNTILHGACLIFSRDYLSKENGFFDGTFMYLEEDILKYICDRKNYLMLYSPDLYIHHKEEASSKLMYTDFSKRLINKNKRIIDSINVYIKLLENS